MCIRDRDYSEMHLVNFTYDGTTDPLGGFSGDSNYCGSAKGKLDIGCKDVYKRQH